MKNLRIWHVGNWCIHLGQKYVESPFEAPSKDVEVVNYAQPFGAFAIDEQLHPEIAPARANGPNGITQARSHDGARPLD